VKKKDRRKKKKTNLKQKDGKVSVFNLQSLILFSSLSLFSFFFSYYDTTMDSSQPQTQNGSFDPAYIAELEAKVTELTAQLQKLTDMAGRAQADLQNAKQRMEREADELRKFAAAGFMSRLLPVVDNFQRAFKQLPEDLKNHEWVKGVAAIEQDFLKQMTDMGLKKIDSLGQPNDPSKHEVVTVGPGKEGIVTEVFDEGYELHGRVLRPAKVRVGDGSEGNK
jgi:molecular chaperone GrpE